jgi:hypothetical protein
MVTGDKLFPAFDIRDAVGSVADGQPVDASLLPSVRAAVHGLCPTSDRGQQQFVVDVRGCALFNVDTEELIWPRHPDQDIHSDVPLRILTDEDLWKQTRRWWDEEQPREWAAFVWRVAVPLSRRLGLVGAWERSWPPA